MLLLDSLIQMQLLKLDSGASQPDRDHANKQPLPKLGFKANRDRAILEYSDAHLQHLHATNANAAATLTCGLLSASRNREN